MNGIILRGLKNVVGEYYGEAVWADIHDRADLAPRLYVPATDYPDDLVRTLIEATVAETGVEREALLSGLGHALVPDVLAIYDIHIREEWTVIDLLDNVERILHNAFHANRFTNFEPPRIRSEGIGERTQLVTFESNRGDCAMFEGVIEGLGEQYDEHLLVDHRECSHQGADACAFVVTSRGQPPVTASETTGSPESRADPLAE